MKKIKIDKFYYTCILFPSKGPAQVRMMAVVLSGIRVSHTVTYGYISSSLVTNLWFTDNTAPVVMLSCLC